MKEEEAHVVVFLLPTLLLLIDATMGRKGVLLPPAPVTATVPMLAEDQPTARQSEYGCDIGT